MKLKKDLEEMGHEVLVPDIEFEVEGKDTSVGAYLDEHGGIDAIPPNHEIWKRKGQAIKKHFEKIDNSEAVLVVNYEKRGVPNYIGGNTFMEIGYAFGTGKKVYILNEIPSKSAYKEEILGMQPIVLKGDLDKIW